MRGHPAALPAQNRQRDPHVSDCGNTPLPRRRHLRIYLHDGKGVFTPGQALAGNATFGDVDGDGDLDLLADRGSRQAGRTRDVRGSRCDYSAFRNSRWNQPASFRRDTTWNPVFSASFTKWSAPWPSRKRTP